MELLQGVVVLGTTVEGDDVFVDLYGSPANICGSVRFSFRGRKHRREMVTLLGRWAKAGTPLTFVHHGAAVSLQDESDRLEASS